jgi:hypothetical protein
MTNNNQSIETLKKYFNSICYDPITGEFIIQEDDGYILCPFRMGNIATFMDSRRGVKKAEKLRFDIANFILESVHEKLNNTN